MPGSKGRGESAKPMSSTVCYCDGKRELGTLEIFCAGCRKWFHARCLKDKLYGLSFMVCYVFKCADCSSTNEEMWAPGRTSFARMCVTVLANLTYQEMKKRAEGVGSVPDGPLTDPIFFNLRDDIIQFFNEQWENLTSMGRRRNDIWHETVQKSLLKETEVFVAGADGHSFALRERDLLVIGPAHDAVRQIGRKRPIPALLPNSNKGTIDKIERSKKGPKRKRSFKRRNAEERRNAPKKSKFSVCLNRDGFRYYPVEKDICATHRDVFERFSQYSRWNLMPAFMYRVVTSPTVTISPCDRAHQLKLSGDCLSVTGFEGYCLARATHEVSYGTWYYEVIFTSQPAESHIRIGWSQALAPLQACVGFNQFSYGWRSKKGTIFHQARGKHYATGGFKEGDVLGCLISLPSCPGDPNYNFTENEELPPSTSYLPPSRKDLQVFSYKNNYFYQERENVPAALEKLKPLPGSYIEFFLNGVSCGIAFRDLYCGFYYPAVSLYRKATVKCNFGPDFKFTLPGSAKPMCERANEREIDQAVSDMLYLIENEEEVVEEAAHSLTLMPH